MQIEIQGLKNKVVKTQNYLTLFLITHSPFTFNPHSSLFSLLRSNFMGWIKRRVLGMGTYGMVFLAEPTDPTAPPIAFKMCPLAKSFSLQLEKRDLARLRGCSEIVSCLGSTLTFEDGNEPQL
jgi:hypothetical protein